MTYPDPGWRARSHRRGHCQRSYKRQKRNSGVTRSRRFLVWPRPPPSTAAGGRLPKSPSRLSSGSFRLEEPRPCESMAAVKASATYAGPRAADSQDLAREAHPWNVPPCEVRYAMGTNGVEAMANGEAVEMGVQATRAHAFRVLADRHRDASTLALAILGHAQSR